MVIDCQGETLHLFPERALYWPARRTLVLTDLHFGKDATFRRRGLPVPDGTLAADSRRLERLLLATQPKRVLILGDFFHARAGRGDETTRVLGGYFRAWREHRFVLIRGNHDHHAGDPPAEWGIDCVEEPLADGPFRFCHVPQQSAAGYVVAGHLHPGVRLRGADGTVLKAPCFYFGEHYAVLPSFSQFTGMAMLEPAAGARVFAVGPDAVIDVSPLVA